MALSVLRAVFILLMAAVGWYFLADSQRHFLGDSTWLAMAIAMGLGTAFICVDILSPRRKLAIFSGTFFGLVVGILIAYGLSFAVTLVVDQWQPASSMGAKDAETFAQHRESLRQFINLLIGVTTCYLSISFILQTKDDFRFVIPYVEFTKQTKGARPVLLDTSVLIDGRITDVATTGILESRLIVPQFIIDELQAIADSSDRLRRNRGRRGLDVVDQLKANPKIELIIYDSSGRELPGNNEVDAKLMSLAIELHSRVLTNDFNLNKVAKLRGVDVINVNDLANALKPVVLPGERMTVRLQKPGEESGQGVGYLEDGTMVVVEQGRGHLGEDTEFTVTSVLQTSAGKMIFGRISGDAIMAPRRHGRGKADSPPAA
jgi:uncharacterized protein YacL